MEKSKIERMIAIERKKRSDAEKRTLEKENAMKLQSELSENQDTNKRAELLEKKKDWASRCSNLCSQLRELGIQVARPKNDRLMILNAARDGGDLESEQPFRFVFGLTDCEISKDKDHGKFVFEVFEFRWAEYYNVQFRGRGKINSTGWKLCSRDHFDTASEIEEIIVSIIAFTAANKDRIPKEKMITKFFNIPS